MKQWIMVVVMVIVFALLPAWGERWTDIRNYSGQVVYQIDRDSIHKDPSDKLVYFRSRNTATPDEEREEAIDCARDLYYTVRLGDTNFKQIWGEQKWHESGRPPSVMMVMSSAAAAQKSILCGSTEVNPETTP